MTIDDIALALGVSKTTVSRAISGKGRISAGTTERVLDYINEHNYKPNAVARGLAKNRTFNIGVVWPGDYEAVDLPFFKRCMIGMSQVTAVRGYDILVSLMVDNSIDNLRRIVEDHKVDGVVLTRTLIHDEPARFLKESGIPFVVIGSSDDPELVQVDSDNFDACEELTSILLGKGYRNLALLGGGSNHVISRTRRQGFESAFHKAGVDLDPSRIYMDVSVRGSLEVENILEELLQQHVDGVVCMDDLLAATVISVCRKRGIRIPQDLRIASFYNSSILDNTVPAVTSILFNDGMLGQTAAKTLLKLIEGENPGNQMLKNYQIILRESTT